MQMHTDEQLIAGITEQLYDSFTLDETERKLIDLISENILQYIRCNMLREVPTKVEVAARSSKAPLPKGNAYSQFTSAVSAVSRGGAVGTVTVSVVKRQMTPKASELIVGHEADMPYGSSITFLELFERVNSFETRPMNRASLMWNLVSDDDRAMVIRM